MQKSGQFCWMNTPKALPVDRNEWLLGSVTMENKSGQNRQYMKTLILRATALGATISSLMLGAGCQEEEAGAEVPVFAAASPAPATPVTNPILESTNAIPDLPAAKVVQNSTIPENLKVSPALAEIIKLAQAGVTEDVLLAYATNSTSFYNVGSEEILYLNDLGVSSPVITALIRHDATPESLARKQTDAATQLRPPSVALTAPVQQTFAPATAALPPAVAQIPPVQETAPTPVAVQAPATVVYVQPQPPASVSYFYDSLSPYGNWIEVDGYGRCWQPTVAVANSYWQPYRDRGHWLWTDNGWYWYSDYSWGWAPFHYGRWASAPRLGWVWLPDTSWGPSWVSWRQTDTYCGWAPLPPAPHYFGGVSLSIGIFNFIPIGNLCDRDLSRHYIHGTHRTTIYHESTVVEISSNHQTPHPHGIDPSRVARASGREVSRVAIHEMNAPAGKTTRIERLENNGNTLVVARPQFNKAPTPRVPAQASNAGLSANNPGVSVLPKGSPATGNNPAAGTSRTPRFGARATDPIASALPSAQPAQNFQPTKAYSTLNPSPASSPPAYSGTRSSYPGKAVGNTTPQPILRTPFKSQPAAAPSAIGASSYPGSPSATYSPAPAQKLASNPQPSVSLPVRPMTTPSFGRSEPVKNFSAPVLKPEAISPQYNRTTPSPEARITTPLPVRVQAPAPREPSAPVRAPEGRSDAIRSQPSAPSAPASSGTAPLRAPGFGRKNYENH